MAISRKQRLLAASSVLAIGAGITLAAYSDQVDMSAEFTTGTFDIAVDGQDQSYQIPFDITELTPGDTATATVEVQNTGTIDAELHLGNYAYAYGSGLGSVPAEESEFLQHLSFDYSFDGGQSWSDGKAAADADFGDFTSPDSVLVTGDSTELTIRVHYAEDAPNAAQDSRAELHFDLNAFEVGKAPAGQGDGEF